MNIDHRNGIRTDNRWCNLRLATFAQNNANSGPRKKRADLPKGVTLSHGSYVARVSINGRMTYIGTFKTVEDADAAYVAECRLLRGDFAYENRIAV